MVRSTISELTDTTPRWSVQAVRAGEAAGCRLVWLLSSCVQPPAAPQCGDPSSSTSCACDQAARLISGEGGAYTRRNFTPQWVCLA